MAGNVTGRKCGLQMISEDTVGGAVEGFYAAGDGRNVVVPFVFVFDGEVAFELLAFEFLEHVVESEDAFSPYAVFEFAVFIGCYVLEMQREYPAVETSHLVEMVEVHAAEMSYIGAGAEFAAAVSDKSE